MKSSSPLPLSIARMVCHEHNWEVHDNIRAAQVQQVRNDDLDGHFLYLVVCPLCAESKQPVTNEKQP